MTDEELIELRRRNAERLEAAKQALGKKWLLHRANAVLHRDGRQTLVPQLKRRRA